MNGILEIQPWIHSWGDGVEVHEPEALPASIADALRAAATRYAD